MEVWLRRLGIRRHTYLRVTGERTLSDFGRANPDWPLRAWVGLLLEVLEERDRSREFAVPGHLEAA
jgi:hypothetical protein